MLGVVPALRFFWLALPAALLLLAVVVRFILPFLRVCMDGLCEWHVCGREGRKGREMKKHVDCGRLWRQATGSYPRISEAVS